MVACGGKFLKLDLSHAYQQVLLEEKSQEFVTVSTHKGLYRYNWLPFGIASAPAVFQQLMEKVLQGIRASHALLMMYLSLEGMTKCTYETWKRC